jgi:diguanylate cyclase (GGDEF)-like protein
MRDAEIERLLAAEVSRCDSLALLMIEVGKLHLVREALGHAAGDEVLDEIERRLRGLRNGEGQAWHLGGERFVLATPVSRGVKEACDLARLVLRVVQKPCLTSAGEAFVPASIGIALHPQHGEAGRLMSRAHTAMRKARVAGKSTWVLFDGSMDAVTREQAALLPELYRAVTHGQFELHYQPKVLAATAQVVSCEALVRWKHPSRGMISPDRFIPLAERSGLIGRIGEWVIDAACRQAGEWRDRGMRMRVAINLSAYEMRQGGLAGTIGEALKRHSVKPDQLTCEITETVAMEDSQATRSTFEQLGRMGVHLSIDDFGTGYSSLACLRDLPAAELKIDRSFVMDIEASGQTRSIVDAVIKLAHALQMKVVAEGVENERQRETLVAMGCDLLQGYLFARPMPAKSLALWVASDQTDSGKPRFRESLFQVTQPVGE